jgi:hypothetical protein
VVRCYLPNVRSQQQLRTAGRAMFFARTAFVLGCAGLCRGCTSGQDCTSLTIDTDVTGYVKTTVGYDKTQVVETCLSRSTFDVTGVQCAPGYEPTGPGPRAVVCSLVNKPYTLAGCVQKSHRGIRPGGVATCSLPPSGTPPGTVAENMPGRQVTGVLPPSLGMPDLAGSHPGSSSSAELGAVMCGAGYVENECVLQATHPGYIVGRTPSRRTGVSGLGGVACAPGYGLALGYDAPHAACPRVSASGSVVGLQGMNNGVACRDSATGTGYMLYSEANTHSRFAGIHPQNADHFVCVVLRGAQWKYDTNSAERPFTPVSTDVLVATLDFSTDTATMALGVNQEIGTTAQIHLGYTSGDISVIPNMYGGSANIGEWGVLGAHFITHFITHQPFIFSGCQQNVCSPSSALLAGRGLYQRAAQGSPWQCRAVDQGSYMNYSPTGGCTCQTSWAYIVNGVTHSFTDGQCGNPDGSNNPWCITQGSCGTLGTSFIGRWAECAASWSGLPAVQVATGTAVVTCPSASAVTVEQTNCDGLAEPVPFLITGPDIGIIGGYPHDHTCFWKLSCPASSAVRVERTSMLLHASDTVHVHAGSSASGTVRWLCAAAVRAVPLRV